MNVVVVGAGILGASAAYHLAREGFKVTLVDRADEGRATAAGAGIVCPWGSATEDAASYQLLAAGARYYHQLIALLGEDGEHDLGYARVGGLYVPAEPRELDAARAPGAGARRRCAGSGAHCTPLPCGGSSPISALATRPTCPVRRRVAPASMVAGSPLRCSARR